MKEVELKQIFLEEIGKIAPEVDSASVDPEGDLREAFDLDSMDFLNLMTALHARLGIDIPEADYAKLFTLNKALIYLAAHAPGSAP